ncbi:hypothetical protein J6590_074928 [Homalodisca vitripennis]|nr:hypothetical protein J6590_074928 [Homalodisca vitripennis]
MRCRHSVIAGIKCLPRRAISGRSAAVWSQPQVMSDYIHVRAAALLLLQEAAIDMEVDCAVLHTLIPSRESCREMFKERDHEGAYTILVKRHLLTDDVQFKEYFRLTRGQFSHITDLIREDVTVQPSNRVKNPLTAEVKLAVTLR